MTKIQKTNIDIVIPSWSKNNELFNITKKCLDSLFKSEKNISFHVYIIETNKDIEWNDHYLSLEESNHTITTLRPKLPFGYHKCLNQGRLAGKSTYVVLCNNDLTFEKGWASKIIWVMNSHPYIMSASPWNPQTQGSNKELENNFILGRRVQRELAGWCIFQQRKIYDQIGDLDETFTHWYCDNDYGMTLEKMDIKHGLICGSVVNHHDKVLGHY